MIVLPGDKQMSPMNSGMQAGGSPLGNSPKDKLTAEQMNVMMA